MLLAKLRLPKYIRAMAASAKRIPRDRLGVGQLLVRLLYHYRREVAVEATELGYDDIRPPHTHVLAHISGRGIRLTDLAARAQLSLAAASEFVTELEELGYLERRPDLDDGRAKLIVPTRRGRQAFKDGAAGAAAIERHWAALVGDGRFEQACQVLQLLLDRLGVLSKPAGDAHTESRSAVSSKTPPMQTSAVT